MYSHCENYLRQIPARVSTQKPASVFTLHEATFHDLPDFCAFALLVFNNSTWTPTTLQARLIAEDSVLYVLRYGTLLVGTAIVTQYFDDNRPHKYISFVGIHPAYRGQGLGKQLLQFIIGEKRDEWRLYTEIANVPARGLYESLGFKPYGFSDLDPADCRAGRIYYWLLRE